MSLTKEQRDALPASDFAVPDKRALPIHDVTHTKMAWNMLPKTSDLTPEEKSTAKERILERAHKLGVDTKNWNAVQAEASEIVCAISFSAMAIEMPEVIDHPNRIPFKGVLTKLDEPSDAPVGGANGGSRGKRVTLPRVIAEAALPSLLGMAIDFKQDLSGHDAQQKIGLITEASIEGNQINISGFFYGADFPQVVKRIQAEKTQLGFSYEAQVNIQSMNDDPLVINQCVFTGAAVLYKAKAAYRSTSLTASADEEFMTKEVLEAIDKLNQRLDKIEANAVVAKDNSVYGVVKPHADALLAAANEMAAANIGNDPENGHVAVIRKVVNHMMVEAAMGKMPRVLQTEDWLSNVSKKGGEAFTASEGKNPLADEVETLKTEIANLKKANFHASESPDRVTTSGTGTASAKLAAGEGAPVKSFDDFYKEAESKGQKDPAMKTAYALQAQDKQQQNLNKGAN